MRACGQWHKVQLEPGPQGPIVGPVLLKTFISDLDDEEESTPGSFQTIQPGRSS